MTGRDTVDGAPLEPDEPGNVEAKLRAGRSLSESEVARLLGSLPDPGPMPTDVAEQIRWTLSQEPPLLPAEATSAGLASIVPLRARRSGPGLWLAAGAAAAAVTLGVALNSGVLAQFGLTIGGTSGTADSAAAPMAAAITATTSSRSYSPKTLAEQAAQLAQAPPQNTVVEGATKAPELSAGSESNHTATGDTASRTAPPMADPAEITDCLSGLGIAHDSVTVDVATYEGQPAAIALVRAGGAQQAYVLTVSCTGRPDDLIAGPVAVG